MQIPTLENLPCKTTSVSIVKGDVSVDDGAALYAEKDLRLNQGQLVCSQPKGQ